MNDDGLDISAVIPLRNKSGSILAAIESVFTQQAPPARVIVVDDGSTDDSIALITDSEYCDRVHIIHQQQQGPGPARNAGWKACTTGWVAFLDADDVWLPHHLLVLAGLARANPGVEWVAASTTVDWGGRSRSASHGIVPSATWSDLRRRRASRLANYFTVAADHRLAPHSSSTMIRRHVLEEVGGFPQVVPNEDLALWCKLAIRGDVAFASKAGAVIRKDGANITSGLRIQVAMRRCEDPFALRTRPHYSVVERALESGELPEDRRRPAERYLDDLLTRHWPTVLLHQSQACARPALRMVRSPRGGQFRLFQMAACLPRPAAAIAALLSGWLLRFLGLESPVSPFVDRHSRTGLEGL